MHDYVINVYSYSRFFYRCGNFLKFSFTKSIEFSIRVFDGYIDITLCDQLWENRPSPAAPASNEIHFLPVQERYIHALSGNTNCLTIDGQVCFYRRLFTDAVKPATRVHFMVLGRVNRTAWGTKLLLTAVVASLVDCISSCHLLNAHPL